MRFEAIWEALFRSRGSRALAAYSGSAHPLADAGPPQGHHWLETGVLKHSQAHHTRSGTIAPQYWPPDHPETMSPSDRRQAAGLRPSSSLALWTITELLEQWGRFGLTVLVLKCEPNGF